MRNKKWRNFHKISDDSSTSPIEILYENGRFCWFFGKLPLKKKRNGNVIYFSICGLDRFNRLLANADDDDDDV